MRAVGIAGEGIEVVPVEHDVDTRVLAAQHGIADESVLRRVLRL
jgi:hypothetical protein